MLYMLVGICRIFAQYYRTPRILRVRSFLYPVSITFYKDVQFGFSSDRKHFKHQQNLRLMNEELTIQSNFVQLISSIVENINSKYIETRQAKKKNWQLIITVFFQNRIKSLLKLTVDECYYQVQLRSLLRILPLLLRFLRQSAISY